MMTSDVETAHSNRLGVLLCFFAALCEGIDLQAAGVAAAGIRQQFHPDSQWLAYFFSASTAGLFIGAMIGGRLADSLGRKPVLVTSIAVFGLFSVLTALAWNVGSLTLARLLTGFGLGGALPNLLAIGSENAPENRRSAYVTIIYAGNPLGGALASLVSLLTSPAHWSWIFIVGGVTPLIIAPVLGRWLHEPQVFSTLTARGAQSPTARRNVLAFLEEGRALRTVLLWISFLLSLLTLYLLLNWLPTLLASSGFSKPAVAIAMISFNIGGWLSALFIGFHLDTQLRHRGVLVTFISVPLLLLLLALGPTQSSIVALVVFVLGAAVVGAQAILYAFAPLLYPTRIRGTGVGFAVAMGRMGSVAGPLLGGVLVGSGRNTSQVLIGLLPIALACGLCAVVLTWRKPTVREN
jgi:MFS transporter, AAHS family, 3-hydroxyphenylpropionic acid transporter